MKERKASVRTFYGSIPLMQTHLEFRSSEFPAYPGEEEEINPGRYGKRLAEFVAAGLPSQGFRVAGIHSEDWGWRIDLENEEFPLWIGCGNYEEYEDGFLCFLEPSKPSVGRWFKPVRTVETMERLAAAVERIINANENVHALRWWTDAEMLRG